MRSSQIRKFILLAILVALIAIAGSVQIAGFIIEYNWWKEVEQVNTWLSMLWYEIAPAAAGTLIAFIALWLAHARGLQFAGVRFRDLGLYSRLVPVALLVAAALLASASIDYWVVMSYAGSRHITLPEGTPWRDPVFSRTLPFYLFDLPFYSDLLTFAFRPFDSFDRRILGCGAGLAGSPTFSLLAAERRIGRGFQARAQCPHAAGRDPLRFCPRHSLSLDW